MSRGFELEFDEMVHFITGEDENSEEEEDYDEDQLNEWSSDDWDNYEE
jgi:hypothetical protein